MFVPEIGSFRFLKQQLLSTNESALPLLLTFSKACDWWGRFFASSASPRVYSPRTKNWLSHPRSPLDMI